MSGLFITFEGTEGSGKSTQIALLAERLRQQKLVVRLLREPGGTPIGEELRHTLKHSPHNYAMTAEAELLLINASRAQLVREVIRPALAAGEMILCDRFYDSSLVYQGYGRGLDIAHVRSIIDFAVGGTRPHLTILLLVPLSISEQRRQIRQEHCQSLRDRFEEADQAFFKRVEEGYRQLAASEPERIKPVDATAPVDQVSITLWPWVQALIAGQTKPA